MKEGMLDFRSALGYLVGTSKDSGHFRKISVSWRFKFNGYWRINKESQL